MRLLGSNVLSSAREQHHRKLKQNTLPDSNAIATSIAITSGVENILNGSSCVGGYGRGGTIICNNLNDDIVAVYHHDHDDDVPDNDNEKRKHSSRSTSSASTMKNRDVDNIRPPIADDGRFSYVSWRRSKKNLTLYEEEKNEKQEEEEGRTRSVTPNVSASQDDSTVRVEVEATLRGTATDSDNDQGEEEAVARDIETTDDILDDEDDGIIFGDDGAVEVTDDVPRCETTATTDAVHTRRRRGSLSGSTKAAFTSIKSFLDDANCFKSKVKKSFH